MFSTTTTATKRDATGPVAGGSRDAVASGFLIWLVAKATAGTTTATGDPQLGEIAGQAVEAWGPEALALAGGVVVGGFTLLRKWIQTRLAQG